MSEATAGAEQYAAELMDQIGDRYLLLIRENYLDNPTEGQSLREDLVRSLRVVARERRWDGIFRLSRSPDWREVVVGLHYAILFACSDHELLALRKTVSWKEPLLRLVGEAYERDLLTDPSFAETLPARPAFLLFALQNRRDLIIDFLAADRPIGDAADVYAAAFASEQLTRIEGDPSIDLVVVLREAVLARLRAEPWHDDRAFAESGRRFLRSWRFWSNPNVPEGGAKVDFDAIDLNRNLDFKGKKSEKAEFKVILPPEVKKPKE